MAKHRTLAEKKKAAHRKYETQGIAGSKHYNISDSGKGFNEDELLVVDPKYIFKDLIRTLILSLIFLAVLYLLYQSIQSGKPLIPFLAS